MRKGVLLSGLLFAACGGLLILTMPLILPTRVAATVAWLVYCGRDIRDLHLAYRRYRGLVLTSDGRIRLLDEAGNWHAARLLAGSILLRRLGWIRIDDGRGGAFAEPLRGSCRVGQDWRRLQVIWRHFGARP